MSKTIDKQPTGVMGDWNPLDSKRNPVTGRWEQVRDWWKKIVGKSGKADKR